MNALRVGVIGYGYWGPNLARNFNELPGSDLVAIVDRKDSQLQRARAKYPNITLTKDYKELLGMGLDAVIVSTSPKTHFEIAKDCLLHGLHVFIEKPMTLDSRDAEELVELAKFKGLTLMVGHIFEYNSAVLEMKKYIDNKELGEILYIDTARLNLGLFQRDSNVLWDLAPHDISTLLYLLGQVPVSVSAHGMACVTEGVHDVAYLNLVFPNNLMAFIRTTAKVTNNLTKRVLRAYCSLRQTRDRGYENPQRIISNNVDNLQMRIGGLPSLRRCVGGSAVPEWAKNGTNPVAGTEDRLSAKAL